jgi:hypothetical protein
MSLLGKVLLFAVKEVAKPVLANVGRHLGNACGNVLGRKIDEKHGTYGDEDEDCPEDPGDEESEESK